MEGVARPEQLRRAKKDVLSAKEAGAYLAAFRGHAIEPVVVLALACGLRRCELAGLLWSDVDVEAAKLEVRRGPHDFQGQVIEEEPKSENSRRRISVPAWTLEALKPLVCEDGEPMKPCHITRLYGKRIEEAKLRKVSLKNIRHSHACLLIEAGVDLYTVSRRLGHATTAVTELHYVDPSEKADKAAAAALGDLRLLAPGPNGRVPAGRFSLGRAAFANAALVLPSSAGGQTASMDGRRIRRFDHLGITVADLDAVTAFFVGLGLEVDGRTFVEGEFIDTVTGLPDARTEIVMLRPPGGGTAIELSSFVRPPHGPGSPEAMANELGLRSVAFEVDDIQATVDQLAADGYGLIGGIGQYERIWSMAYVRGPEGIIVALAQRIG